ncbi:MFS transporter [Plantibacter sp. YIM 135249]|uniref:MFS transporter n=1 Tax=Plantibacter sp. YIM 135249 TaxID=3423918 RepID=UPI003D33950D
MTASNPTQNRPPRPARFVALRNKQSRTYLIGGGLAMMGDNIEHVITYWILWETFHSPALVGFQVISHWLPSLLFSVQFGALAQRFDCRRLIQIAQLTFILVSVTWGVLIATGTLQIWLACILLLAHGFAGALWRPAEQMMLHDFADREDLPGTVRMNATFRSLGVLFGPVVGSALLLGLGPVAGIFTNVLFYLPLSIFLLRTPFTGHVRDGMVARGRISFLNTLRVLKRLWSHKLLVSMILLAGASAVCVGGSLQASMPHFAAVLGTGDSGLSYGALLFASGAGGVLGGFLLEATGAIKPNARAAFISTAIFGATIVVFALTQNYVIALVALFLGGVADMASASIAQSVVQLEAPSAERGHVLGAYGMASSGLSTGNGITLAALGAAIGISATVAWGGAVLILATIALAVFARVRRA